MATLKEIQNAIDNNTFDPSKYTNNEQKSIIDQAIKKGLLTGPTMDELQAKRMGAAKDVATIEEAIKNPIGVQLQQEGSSLDGRSEAVLAGDLIGSIYPYVAMRKKYLVLLNQKYQAIKIQGYLLDLKCSITLQID